MKKEVKGDITVAMETGEKDAEGMLSTGKIKRQKLNKVRSDAAIGPTFPMMQVDVVRQ